VRYHFAARDGRRYDGISKIDSLDGTFVSNGTPIAVLYDRDDPKGNGWRMALDQAAGEFTGIVAVSLLACSWLGLFIYRYTRWRSGNAGIRIAHPSQGAAL
jgi:hypothetical protein